MESSQEFFLDVRAHDKIVPLALSVIWAIRKPGTLYPFTIVHGLL